MGRSEGGSLGRTRESYRRVFWGAALLALLQAIVIAGLIVPLFPVVSRTDLGILIAGLAVALLVLLRWGFAQLRLNLDSLDAEHRALLDNAYRDALTGAHGRAHFLRALRDLLTDPQRPIAYLQIDMDNLKVLNDASGHAAGDQALVHLVETLRRVLPGALIGRLGGDEFGIALVGSDNRAALLRVAQRLLASLAEPIAIDGRQIRLSATLGLALWPHDAISADELVSKADIALYRGKKNGRAVAVAFEAELLADERYKRFIERELRAAILLNELELHYQPLVAAGTRRPVSHEALVRWQHPVRGQIMPADFIPIAEQSDLIDKLGDWVMRRALADLPRLGTPTVSVNVSAVQLRRPDFADRVLAALSESGTQGERLVLEVTESLQLQAGPIEMRNLAQLRAKGVRIAIDDFGAGFASLGYVRGIAFDSIKIDRSYVRGLPQSRIDGLIVTAICKIGRAMKLQVVAEGVETEEQLAFLQKAGCGQIQGFLIARPAPLADLEATRQAA